MVLAVVCCTKCARKFQNEFPDNNWGDMLHIICPQGHKSYEVLDPDTRLNENDIVIEELFEKPTDDDDKELVGA